MLLYFVEERQSVSYLVVHELNYEYLRGTSYNMPHQNRNWNRTWKKCVESDSGISLFLFYTENFLKFNIRNWKNAISSYENSQVNELESQAYE